MGQSGNLWIHEPLLCAWQISVAIHELQIRNVMVQEVALRERQLYILLDGLVHKPVQFFLIGLIGFRSPGFYLSVGQFKVNEELFPDF